MPIKLPWMKLLTIIGPIVLLGSIIWFIYSYGYNNGKDHIQRLWDKDKQVQQNEMIRIKDENAQKEQDHSAASIRIADELQNTKDSLAIAITDLNREHSLRMQVSADRAKVYQRLSQAGPSQCEYLAGHAAKLDASLEEGRGLVKEFRATLGQREDQLKLLGSQILADRKLMETDNGSSNNGISAR